MPVATFEGGREWRVDASRFPISQTVTGVVLDLDPAHFAPCTGIQPHRDVLVAGSKRPGKK